MPHYSHYTKEQIDYLRSIAYKRTIAEITELFNQKYDENRTARSIQSKLAREGIHNKMQGYQTQFKKGHIPFSKGMKGLRFKGSEKGWMKKGNTVRRKPIGSERIDEKDKCVMIKVAHPKVWKKKHTWVWRQAYGEIPKQHAVAFKDGDFTNCDLDNLYLVHQNAIVTVAKRGQKTEYPEINYLLNKATELEITANVKARDL
jgi:hypothetical protein